MESLLSVFRDLDMAMTTCSRAQASRRLRAQMPNLATLPAASTTPVSHSSMLSGRVRR
jgi:hypothetical protein